MEEIVRQRHLIDILTDRKLDKKLRLAVLTHSPDSFICLLCACALNLCQGKLPLKDEKILRKLKRHRNWIKTVASTQQTAKNKRKTLKTGAGKSKVILDSVIPLILNLALEYFDLDT